MKPAEGLEVQLVASEPLIRQPLSMTFDARGRLWVIQYLQYPKPAGLKPEEVDQYLRTKYDRVPEPPPRGPRGLDRITILEDRDEQGRFHKTKDFVTGLNLASGLALGNGGVYVLQAPYLLFYPDRDGDDVPDGDPEVVLTGFGMEDSHAVANSLVWGPDGWLYGAQGSTVTARITDPLTRKIYEFQQGIWRYHPRTRQFELFAEGGGNTWGLDFDSSGQIIAGTNWGGVAGLHMVQGGYYVKGFAKHGPLHNLHTYGYFEHIPCESFRGGHVTCGGIVYQGKLIDARYQNNYLACNLLDNNLYWYSLKRQGSSFKMRHEGTLLQSNDTWFRPIDLLTGPEGAVYVCDWYDKRANHVDPLDNWDKTNGRIYRLVPTGGQIKSRSFDLNKASSQELVDLLGHDNSWQRGEARRILAERHDEQSQALLRKHVVASGEELSIDSLWALYSSGGLDARLAGDLLRHPKEVVRAWVVRMISDHATTEGIKCWLPLLPQLANMARVEKSYFVRSQLACTARRLAASLHNTEQCYAVLSGLLQHDEDVSDQHIPLLLWWALEEAIQRDHGIFALVSLGLDHGEGWRSQVLREHLLERLSRLLLSIDNDTAVHSLLLLIEKCLVQEQSALLVPKVLHGMEKALEGRRLKGVPGPLRAGIEKLSALRPDEQQVLRILIRMDDPVAFAKGKQVLRNQQVNHSDRSKLLLAMTQGTPSLSVDTLLSLYESAQTDATRLAMLDALAAQNTPQIAPALLKQYSKASLIVRQGIINLLVARKDSAQALGEAMSSGMVTPKEVPLDKVQQLVRYHDPQLDQLVARHWGNVTAQTTGEKQARIRSVVHILGQGKGDVQSGKTIYTKQCGTCHTLFGEGGKVGPELTGADRHNRDFLATHIVDPNFVIRPEYVAHTIVTTDGRTLTGLLVEQNVGSMTVLDAQANKITLARNKIEDIQPSKVSLMPEKLLDSLDDQQIRDLLAYLQQPMPAVASTTLMDAPSFQSEPLNVPDKFDFADKMVGGIDRFLNQELAASVQSRQLRWKKEYSSSTTYLQSVEGNRARLKVLLGAVEERPKKPVLEYISGPTKSARIGQGSGFDAFAIRWRAFGHVDGEGLLLVPTGKIKADVVALPDADQTPEQLSGLAPGLNPGMQMAKRLAEQGCRVIVPVLIDRSDAYSGVPGIRMTNQPHREWIYRQSFEMGQHIIGYEILKSLAAVDWLLDSQQLERPVGLVGYAEGGLIAFHAGALDTRIAVTCVDGYFSAREGVWREPIYRNVWRQLTEFGDAQIAALYPPRKLVINQLPPPTITGPPMARSGRSGAAPGSIGMLSINQEWARLEPLKMAFPDAIHLSPASERQHINLSQFYRQLTNEELHEKAHVSIENTKTPVDADNRVKRQIEQLAEHTQGLLHQSHAVREKLFWSKLDRSGLTQYQDSTETYRKQLEHEVIGKIERPLSPPRARSRKLYEQPNYVAYEVELDVFAPEVIAYGWFLIPKGIKPGERRPVVVCQHGLDGRPADVADPKFDSPYYHRFACQLAERGFIVFAPQNPYIFGDRFRMLQRKANPLGLSLFSFIVAQHRQITDWLAALSFVDPDRIGFYGLSYGGKTAMRVPALLPRYCLSICSADFNEWIWKNVSIDNKYTYMTTNEWEMVEFNLGNTFNYAEMAALIAPRPFMVERGHHDGVGSDEQVSYEYAKVRRLYLELKIPHRTAIEFFDGPHTIHGVGTYRFLHQHLNWPEPR
ncbi:MAG TPA: c-type cytochrome [Gemmatales bacterium]|nr:c-type cytochrome [Gemmatales bacterium]